jgi:SprA family protein
MVLQSPVRLPAQPLESAEPVQLRRESSEQKEDFTRALANGRRGSSADQAAVVHFGSRALGLARSQPPPPPDASLVAENGGEVDVDEAAAQAVSNGAVAGTAVAVSAGAGPAASSGPADADSETVSDEEQQELDEMKRRDREVRTHEQAHKAAGGAYTGSMRLTFQMGPDGKRYAVEGSVPIDVSPVAGDPAATLRKMEVVARAANAPASPSGPDRAVAAQATRAMQQARAQLAAERYAQARELVSGA